MIKIETVVNLVTKVDKLVENAKSIGFVPTMGALHLGHLKLIEIAKQENDIVVCSIFVNPLQFNRLEDLEKYPNRLEEDSNLLESINCDILFCPTNKDVYQDVKITTYDFGFMESLMEGEKRPGHFNGVANVISRLFEIVRPNKAYFGEKDYQQLAIIRKLATENYPKVEIVPCKTVSNSKGLALSSRNFRLNENELSTATKIYEAMQFCLINKANNSPTQLIKFVSSLLADDFNVEYIMIADEVNLQPIENWSASNSPRIFIAAHLAGVRLIDNLSLIH